ncbi:hypothetical protein B0H14DRAFT_2596085 [Mycena olivaceomarginata]|nr:hypothetical protein B0H14DRAFT_2596085 [Mycena olivaceomarginata]
MSGRRLLLTAVRLLLLTAVCLFTPATKVAATQEEWLKKNGSNCLLALFTLAEQILSDFPRRTNSPMSLSQICKGLFDGNMSLMQRSSPDIVIYCPELILAVRVAWPVYNGRKVPPLLMGQYLESLKVFWPCFCSRHTSDFLSITVSVSCRIVTALGTGTTIATCHFDPPRCQFFLNLTTLIESTKLKGNFDTPTPLNPLALFMTFNSPGNISLCRPVYLPGYIGERGKQLNEVTVFDTIVDRYIVKEPSIERGLLTKLAAGQGISSTDAQRVFVGCVEGCNQCGAAFVEGAELVTALMATPNFVQAAGGPKV